MSETVSDGSGQAHDLAVLTAEETYCADRLAIEGGIAGRLLMAAAGRAVAAAVMDRRRPGPVLVLCGPGNNGGDGFVAATHLAAAGWPVRLALLGPLAQLKGDAATAAATWRGPVLPLEEVVPVAGEVVVDALFGIGLARPLSGAPARLARQTAEGGHSVVAVDVPSGLTGDGAAPLDGLAFQAEKTVTFFRKKPAHLLVSAREFCGSISVADIGLPSAVLDRIAPQIFENGPALWLDGFAWRSTASHKYLAGHLLVLGGTEMTGAAQLACRAGLRIGAGLVSVAAAAASLPIYAVANPGVITLALREADDFAAALDDRRRNVVLLGPGNGVSAETRAHTVAALGTRQRAGVVPGGAPGRAVVLDADALTVFQEAPGELWRLIGAYPEAPVVLTPHEGEFARLFPNLTGNRLQRARAAARRSGATVVLKGPDTIIAAPDGRAAINAVAPPWLATAGSGDVLAGMIGGLLAQGMPAFQGAAAAVWLHGCAAQQGPGLIAEDLPEALPEVLRRLWKSLPQP